MQHDLQQHKLAAPNLNGQGPSGSEPVMVNGITVEDDVGQLQLQLQMVQSHLRYDVASIDSHVFESYDETYQWAVATCRPEEWKYAAP
jgi:hypothetical protein